ncbi:MAG TPA: ergothioneine biosynthesis protein EgtB [Thermoanaerobaculia bacterium]|nr:ergothioneine biosynthesis protein EgtB [Thermoanaerobaculia bacterium]
MNEIQTAAPPAAPPPAESAAVNTDLAARFRTIRETTSWLAAPLSPEDCTVQAMPDASPTKWHLAHTSWFFETFVLVPGLAGYSEFHPDFRVLFNSYYNSVGAQHARFERGLITRPSLAETRAYREHVDAALLRLLEKGGLSDELAAFVEVGLHHEQQHQELIVTDLKALFARNPLGPVYRPALGTPAPGAAPPLGWKRFEEGVLPIGHDGPGFAFDNEGPRHRVFLESFEIATRPATAGEYLEFMDDGGYRRPELWLSEGWGQAQANGWQAPLYWLEREGRTGDWHQQTLAGWRPVDPAEAVCHLSFYEADAFARWAGARLPTEAEWEVAATAELRSGRKEEGNFLEDGRFHPAAPASLASPSKGLSQLFGDVWEWTQSPYVGYPGYRPPQGALGEYNGKFMVNQIVLRGGSCATPRSHIRATYRNFFPTGARWQFSGVRLARDAR